jgi:hypothetical protein
MKTTRAVAVFLAVATLGATTTLAIPPGPGPEAPPPETEFGGPPQPGRPPMPCPEQLKKAGATVDQISLLMDFQYQQEMKRIDRRAAADKAQVSLDHLLYAAAVDEKAVMEAVDAVNQARSEMFKLDIAGMLMANQLLGTNVLRKLRELAPPPRNFRCGRRNAGESGDEWKPEAEIGE